MKAVYAGSFDPFTNGHLDIVRKASKLFEEVYVVVAYNYDKKRKYNVVASAISIEEAIRAAGIENVSVHYWPNLVVDFCQIYGAKYLIRGLRSPGDYVYEENVANINKELAPDIETIYFRADSSIVSSTMIREMLAHGRKVDKYVPPAIVKMIMDENSLVK